MRTRMSRASTWTLMATAVVGVSCNEPGSRHPTGPSAPFIGNVEIVGPDSIAPGASANYRVELLMADGTRKAPSSVRWITNTPTLSVTPSGRVTNVSGQAGEGILSADVTMGSSVRRGSKEIVVVPDGTFRLAGTVTDEEVPGLVILGARVEVTPGPHVTFADADGRFRLYGVPANVSMRITADGYTPLDRNINLTGHASLPFSMRVSGPRRTLNGNYTLGLDVLGSCTGLPSNLQTRRYDATLTQIGINVDVRLTESRFRIHTNGRGNRFFGRAVAGGATFTLNDYEPDYYYFNFFTHPDVAEQLTDGTFLVVSGSVVATGTGAEISGEMLTPSALRRWNLGFPTNPGLLGGCTQSSRIRLSLIPR